MIDPILNEAAIAELKRLIDDAQHIVITCHLSPDGDAVGSTLALCQVLRALGKDAQVVTPDQVPKSLSFIPHYSDIAVYTLHEARCRYLVSHAQLVFCLDFNTLKRIDKLGEVIEQSHAPKVLIDHHLNPDDIFEVSFSFPLLSSTCEVVYRVLMQLGMSHLIDVPTAQCLYTGMLTDTGNFTYSSDYPEIYEIVADLVSRRIDKEWLYNRAMNTFSADCLRLQGYAIDQKMQVFAAQHAALIVLTREELARYNYRKGDTEGLVNKPLAIPGVDWSMFMREDPDYIKISCRSRGNFSVSGICNKYFGGGGHKNAAGGEFHGTIDEAVELYFKILEDIGQQPGHP